MTQRLSLRLSRSSLATVLTPGLQRVGPSLNVRRLLHSVRSAGLEPASQQTGALKPYSQDEEGSFYNHTTGTWLYNCEAQLSIRNLQFNVDALIRECVTAGNASSCVSFKKLTEGTSNRVFVARLDNGKELIARLPLPMAGPARLTTASEVATMEFARMRLNTPTPVVLAYCTVPTETDVGSEFIIMEKVPGVQLHSRWNDDLEVDAFAGLTRDLVKVERSWADAQLPFIGSLYFAKDLLGDSPYFRLPEDVPRHGKWGDIVIGPSVARRFWRGGRAQLHVDRGPWKDLHSQISATVQCQIEWLTRFATPHPRESPLYRSERENAPETHIELLRRCLQIIPLLPDQPEFSRFCVWHPDLHASNVIVDETGPLTPKCFLDWQMATVESLVDIPMPPFLAYSGGKYIQAEYGPARPPGLPEGYDDLSEHEQAIARTEQRLAARSQYYHYVTQRWNPALHAARFSAWQWRYLMLVDYPSRTWEEGLAPLKQTLIDIWQSWSEIAPKTPCPITFSQAEVLANERGIVGWMREESVKLLYDEIGLGPDGLVKEDKLEDARRCNREALERTVAEVEHPDDKTYIRRRWPFQDGAFSPTAETCR